jgi:phosphoribosylglycinamide formyltransferase 1
MNLSRRRLVILASGEGTNLQAILRGCSHNEIHADVVAVLSNLEHAGALQRARRENIPGHYLEPRQFRKDRRAYDRALAELAAEHQPDFVVLSGWMRILSSDFLDRFPEMVINLHPARPNELPGINSIERAFEEAQRGQRTSSGIMVHYVPDERVDAGPVIRTVDVPIKATDSLPEFTARMHEAEHLVLISALATLCRPTCPPDDHKAPTLQIAAPPFPPAID